MSSPKASMDAGDYSGRFHHSGNRCFPRDASGGSHPRHLAFAKPRPKKGSKSLTIDGLKNAIANFFQRQTAFLIVDDAHGLSTQFRVWLKALKRQGVPMLLLATKPPKTDIFINLPRIELAPLAEYAIRELMEQAALERGLNLKNHELARLQERVGGNPNLAIRTIQEEYLGLEVETGDHGG